MKSNEWQCSAVALGAAYRRGDSDPVQALQSVQARIAAVNPQLNAFIALDPAAQQAAEASRARFSAGAPLGPLDGIPVGIKDNLLLAGLPAHWGCAALRDYVPDADELPVARLRAAGAVLLGKTNVPEFTLEGYTDNRIDGTTRNPWNPALTPGGSSGGAVAAVASGMGPLALGTDGGGSIRRPASHTGLVGLKPSIGAIARGNGFPQLLLDFEVVGPIGRSVDDVALAYGVLAGPDLRDRVSRGLARAGRIPSRILFVPCFGEAPVDPDVRASVAAAAEDFRRLGLQVEEGVLPLELDEVIRLWTLVGQIGLARLAEIHPAWMAGAAAKYRDMAQAGAAVPASRLWEILERIDTLRRETDGVFTRWDAILTPTAAALPWPAQEAFPPRIDGVEVGPRGHAVFTGWVNATGNPALNLPARPSPSGLPIGFQLVGPWGGDEMLLELGRRYEALHPQEAAFAALWERLG